MNMTFGDQVNKAKQHVDSNYNRDYYENESFWNNVNEMKTTNWNKINKGSNKDKWKIRMK